MRKVVGSRFEFCVNCCYDKAERDEMRGVLLVGKQSDMSAAFLRVRRQKSTGEGRRKK